MRAMFGKVVLPTNNRDINGIIHRIKNIEVTCDSTEAAESVSKCVNAITPSKDHHYCSGYYAANSWLSISFANKNIYITNYSIQAPKDVNKGWYPPVSWKFYGIYNRVNTLIDHVEQSNLNESDKCIVTRKTELAGPFHSFNLSMYDKNYGNLPALRIYKIDIFGIVKIRSHFTACVNNINSKNNIATYITYIILLAYS